MTSTQPTASVATEHLPVFVYGTLRVGCGNYSWALAGRTSHEQEATFTGGTMHDNGGFPFVVREVGVTDEAIALGDLVDVPADLFEAVLRDLDGLEGYVAGRDWNMYERIEVEVLTTGGETVRAYTYVAAPSMYDHVRGLPLIPSGDWISDGERGQRHDGERRRR